MSYLKDREIWLSNVPTGNPPAGYFWKFVQNGRVVVRDSSGNNQIMVATSGSQAITGSLTVTGGITGTATTASYVEYSNVANKPALVSGSAQIAAFGYATTGSNGFNGSQSITGSLTVTGQVVAQTLNVQQVTSSIVYSSGSNIFGNSLANTQQFTGSMGVTGSLTVAGTTTANGISSIGREQAFTWQRTTGTASDVYSLNADSGAAYIYNNTTANVLMSWLEGGNVGIGTASPSQILDVQAARGAITTTSTTGTNTSYLQVNNTGGTLNIGIDSSTGGSLFGAGGYTAGMWHSGAYPLTFGTSNTERLRITSGGNLLVGTTSDNGARLQVSGQGTFTDSANGFNLNLTKTAGFGALIQLKNTSVSSSDLIRVLNSSDTIISRIEPATGGINFAQGNVGINQNTPTNLLHLAGASATPSLRLGSISAGFHYDIGRENQTTGDFLINASVAGTSQGTYFRLAQSGGAATFSSSVTARGINTFLTGGFNDTTYALNASISSNASASSVAPVARFSNNGGGFVTKIMFSDNNRGDAYITHVAGSAFVPSSRWLGFGVDAVDQMIINASGNVGIGTTTPSERLEVNGSLRLIDGNADGPQLKLASSGFSDWNIDNFSGNLRAYYGSTEYLRVTSGGNVGIGTNNPTKRLQVEASVAGEVTNIKNTRNNGNGDYALVTELGSNANNTNNYHYIAGTGGADRMYVYGNGNIVNTNGSYGTLSDISLKENIVDATPKLADLLQLKVRNFNLIGSEEKQIGFVAQEFEEIFPKMVDIDGKNGMKTIKTSVLVPMLVKAIQEQQTLIESLKSRIEILEQ